MEAKDKESLVQSLNTLVVSNGLLTEAHHKVLSMMERSLKEKDEIVFTCREIYEGLSIKEKRSLADESIFLGLQKILHK